MGSARTISPSITGSKGSELIKQTQVGDAVAQEEEAVDPEPVVDGDADHTIARKGGAVVGGYRAGAVGKGAAVDPHHHRKAGAAHLWGPDIEVQALLAGYGGFGENTIERWEIGGLGHVGPKANASRTPSQLATGCGG